MIDNTIVFIYLAATLAIALTTAVGCTTNDNHMGGGSSANDDVDYEGPYTVRVYDDDTGEAIRGAVVEWDFYFASEKLDALKRHHTGVESTDAEGKVTIPKVEVLPGDEFVDLKLIVTKGGYLEARQTVKPRGFFSSNTVVFELEPIKPIAPMR